MNDPIKKSIFVRAIKFSLISSAIIILLVIYRMLTSDVVGTPLEILIRFITTSLSVLGAMYIIFVIYLYFNPEADTQRKTDNKF